MVLQCHLVEHLHLLTFMRVKKTFSKVCSSSEELHFFTDYHGGYAACNAVVVANTLNIIHYMHDKYCYERAEMALHDRDVKLDVMVRMDVVGMPFL